MSRRLRWVRLWDGRWELGWISAGLPAFPFRGAPSGLATRRQLRAAELCPGGHEPAALLEWRGGRAWAALYRLDLAQPKRIPTIAQRRTLRKAMTARRTCRTCGRDAGHCLPTTTRQCWTCDPDNPDQQQPAAA
uniref:RRQRL motif-containing zinc-binding protein n=1 Tax=Saccharopolyspora galaxeae TaxID=2781241 RepID=UPI00190E0ED2|nr:RRQRL motif-containing zinc-binding protein [Saccharopolyspora sp. HNM0986]